MTLYGVVVCQFLLYSNNFAHCIALLFQFVRFKVPQYTSNTAYCDYRYPFHYEKVRVG